MNKEKAVMGIENEFTLVNRHGLPIDGTVLFTDICYSLAVPYFLKAKTCLRLATGGSFYIDGIEPEITTAPYLLEKGSVTALTTNLVVNRNVLVDAIAKVNERKNEGYALNGYSAHYSFTFPSIAKREEGENDKSREICLLLATTVNPALQLLLENRHSGGIMFRDREEGRVEICADFIPGLEDNISAVAFQASMLKTIDYWLAEGASIEDIYAKLKYKLPSELVSQVRIRSGYILKTPEVIANGRKGLVEVYDGPSTSSDVKVMSAQDLLEHYCAVFEGGMEKVLTEEEKKSITDALTKTRNLPIDHRGYPRGYNKVKVVAVDPSKAYSPIMAALGNSVTERKIGESDYLRPTSITWKDVAFEIKSSKTRMNVSLDDLVLFDDLVLKDPELVAKIINGKLTEADLEKLGKLGLENPDSRFGIVRPYVAPPRPAAEPEMRPIHREVQVERRPVTQSIRLLPAIQSIPSELQGVIPAELSPEGRNRYSLNEENDIFASYLPGQLREILNNDYYTYQNRLNLFWINSKKIKFNDNNKYIDFDDYINLKEILKKINLIEKDSIKKNIYPVIPGIRDILREFEGNENNKSIIRDSDYVFKKRYKLK